MKYILNTKESYIKWKGSDDNATYLGTVKFKEGEADVDNHQNVTGGIIIVDMTTINSTGPDLDDDEQCKLSTYLKSKELFDTAHFHDVIFKVERSNFKDDLSGQVTGIFKVMGNAFGLTIPVKIMFGEDAIKAIGDFDLSRVSAEIYSFIDHLFKDLTPQIAISLYVILDKI